MITPNRKPISKTTWLYGKAISSNGTICGISSKPKMLRVNGDAVRRGVFHARLLSRADPKEWLMAVSSYNTVTSFFDESGKFKDHKVISFGGVSSYNEDFPAFAEEWNRLLVKNGLKVLHA